MDKRENEIECSERTPLCHVILAKDRLGKVVAQDWYDDVNK